LPLLTTFVLAATKPRAEEKKAPQENRATAILNAMLKTYDTLGAFEQRSNHMTESDFNGRKNRKQTSVHFAYRKPNKFLYKVAEPQQGVTVVCDGKSVWIYSVFFKQYIVKDPPRDMRSAAEVLGSWGRTYMDAFAFIQGDTPFRDVRNVRLTGTTTIGQTPVYIVELQGIPRELHLPTGTTRLFIGKRDHLLYKSETRAQRTSSPAGPGDQKAKMEMLMTKSHSAMKINGPISDATFVFHPPANARQVTSFSSER
jgi:outer membrane lipoprotein-sorting protein